MCSPVHFVLVHGACHGGWCWYRIKCLLENAGHKVSCPDLKSLGIDPSNANTVFKFDEYNEPLYDVLSELGDDEKVILVAHSVGGLSVMAAMYKYKEKIQAAVFVAAAMVRDTSSGQEVVYVNSCLAGSHWIMISNVPDYMSNDKIFDYHFGEGFDKPPTSITIKKAQRKYFYQRSPLEDSTLAGMLLKPQPVRALMDGKFGDEDVKIDDVPRVYIKTIHDNLMPSDRQDDMIEQWPPSDLYTVDSDHSAFFSNPLDLFGLLLKVAAKYTWSP